MELWIGLLALLAALFNSFRQAYVKKLTDGLGVLSLSYLIMLYATVLVLPFSLYSISQMSSLPDLGPVVMGLTSGIFGIGKTLSGIKALEQADLSVADPFLKLSPLLVFTGEFFLLNIGFGIFEILGLIMAVIGSYLIVVDRGNALKFWKHLDKKGVRYALYATLFASASTLSLKFASIDIDAYFLTGLWYLSGVLSITFYLYVKGRIPSIEEHLDKRYVFVGLYSAVLGLATVYMFSVASAAVVSAILQFSVIPSVIIGGKLFAEEDIVRKLSGGALIIIGTGILILL